LIKTIKGVFDSFSLDDLLSQQLDLSLGLEDIIRINLSRLEKFTHDEIMEQFSTNPQQYLDARPSGLTEVQLCRYLYSGLPEYIRDLVGEYTRSELEGLILLRHEEEAREE
jgi:hypothetical protein